MSCPGLTVPQPPRRTSTTASASRRADTKLTVTLLRRRPHLLGSTTTKRSPPSNRAFHTPRTTHTVHAASPHFAKCDDCPYRSMRASRLVHWRARLDARQGTDSRERRTTLEGFGVRSEDDSSLLCNVRGLFRSI